MINDMTSYSIALLVIQQRRYKSCGSTINHIDNYSFSKLNIDVVSVDSADGYLPNATQLKHLLFYSQQQIKLFTFCF